MRLFRGRKGMLSEKYTFFPSQLQPNIYQFEIVNTTTGDNYKIISHGINWDTLNYKFEEVK